MDELADLTTIKFRDNKPKAVWIVDTWKTLKKIKYERLNSNVINSKVTENKAVFVIDAKIRTVGGDVNHKEIYYLVKEGEGWFIDELIVTDEEIDLKHFRKLKKSLGYIYRLEHDDSTGSSSVKPGYFW